MARLDKLAELDGAIVSYNDAGYIDLYGAINACVRNCKETYRSAKALYKKLLRDELDKLPSPPDIRIMGKTKAVNFDDFKKIFELLSLLLPALSLETRWLGVLSRAVGPEKYIKATNNGTELMGTVGLSAPEPEEPETERHPMGHIEVRVKFGSGADDYEAKTVQCIQVGSHVYVKSADIMRIFRPDDPSINGTWRRALLDEQVCLRYQPKIKGSNAKYIRAYDLEDLVKAAKAEELTPWAKAIYAAADEWGAQVIMSGVEEANNQHFMLLPLTEQADAEEQTEQAGQEAGQDTGQYVAPETEELAPAYKPPQLRVVEKPEVAKNYVRACPIQHLTPSGLFLLRARAALKQVMVDAHHYAQVYLAHSRKHGVPDPTLDELYTACTGAALRNTGVTSIDTFERMLAKSDYPESMLKTSLGGYLGVRPQKGIDDVERERFQSVILPKITTATFNELFGWSSKSGLFSFMG